MNHKNIGHALLAGSMLFGATFATGAFADVNKLAETCASCHGENGNNTEHDVPNIAGFSAKYFDITMKHYKKPDRPCVETEIRSGPKKGTKTDMCAVVKDLSNDDIKQLADFYAGKKFERATQKFDAALAAKGKSIHEKNCDKCHSEAGSVADDDAGFLAGQKMEYLKEQIDFYLAGKRPLPKKMKPKIEALSKDQIEAVIHYYGSVK